jgi:hypothetical protein
MAGPPCTTTDPGFQTIRNVSGTCRRVTAPLCTQAASQRISAARAALRLAAGDRLRRTLLPLRRVEPVSGSADLLRDGNRARSARRARAPDVDGLGPHQSVPGSCGGPVGGPTLQLSGEEGRMRHGQGRLDCVGTAGDESTEGAAPRTEAAFWDRGHIGDGLRSEGYRGEARRLRWPSCEGAREEAVGLHGDREAGPFRWPSRG